ncbi:MAG: glycosyltransferase family 4 protein [Candidatus Acidiferrales bacterium]
MISRAKIEKHGVALLATRLGKLGADPCGGSEVVLWEDAKILQDAGIPVRVYARAAFDGAPVHILPLRTSMPVVTSLEYGMKLLRREPDALIVAYNETALAGFAPDRVIVRFDWTTPLPRCWNWPFWLSRFQRARYLFPSENEKRLFLERHHGIPEQRTSVIWNAVDLRLFHPANSEGETRQPGTLRVGYAGQWEPDKGIYHLLEAWRAVKSAIPRAELCLAGGLELWKTVVETPGSIDCTAKVRQMECDGMLSTVGALPRNEMPAFWNSLSVAVVPSFHEAFGLIALEAMACGIPVVASAVGGLKEIVEDSETGMLVPPGDAAALAQALITLLTNEPLRLRLAQGALRRAQMFSLERRSRLLLELFLDGKMMLS